MADTANTPEASRKSPASEGAELRERLAKGELSLEALEALYRKNRESAEALKKELVDGLSEIRDKEKSGTPLTPEERVRKESLKASAIRLRELLVWHAEARSVVFEHTADALDSHLQNVEKSFKILEESRKDSRGLSKAVTPARKFESRGTSLEQKDLNLASFTKILEGKSASDLAALSERLNKAQSEGGNATYEILRNELGYKFNSYVFVNGEAKEFVLAVERVASYKGKSASQALEFLVDEDWSGHVLAASDSREAQIYHVFSDPSRDSSGLSGEAKIASVIERVTGKPFSEFDKDPAGYKAAFLRELNLRLSYGVPLSTIAKGKTADFRKEQRKVYETVAQNLSPEDRKKIDAAIENHPKLKEIVASLDPEQRESIFDRIRLAAVGVSLGSNTVVGAGFDISKATNGIIDGFVVGFLNGKPMFGISKNLAKAADGSWSVDATLGYSGNLGIAPGIRLTTDKLENDKGTAGIRRMVQAQAKMFDVVAAGLKSDDGAFSESALAEFLKDVPESEKEGTTRAVKDMHASLSRFTRELGATDPKDREALIAGLRSAYLSQAELTANTLKTNDGTTFVGLSPDLLGLARIATGAAGILLFLIGSLKFERFTRVKHKESKSGVHQFAESSTGAERAEKLKGTFVKFPEAIDSAAEEKGRFVALRLPMMDADIDKIVAATPIQVEKRTLDVDGTKQTVTYVSGDRATLSKMRVLKVSTNSGSSQVLYFGDVRHENGRITYAEPTDKITRSVSDGVSGDASPSARAGSGLELKSDLSPEVATALSSIGEKISRRTLNGSAEARVIQSEIYKLLSGSGDLEKTFLRVKRFLKVRKLAVPEKLDSAAKLAVIERVYGAFMKDIYLEGKPNTAEAHAKRKAEMKKHLEKAGMGAFVKSVDAASEKAPFLGKIPAGSTLDQDIARAYVFLTMGMVEFDAFGGRRQAFENRVSEFVGSPAESASVKASIRASQKEYVSKSSDAAHFVPETYAGKSLITFPVSSQIDANGKLIHKGMAPILGSVVVARRGAGGEENFVALENESLRRAMVDRMPSAAIAKIAVRLGLDPSAKETDAAVRAAMKDRTAIGGAKVEFDAVFFKWGDCFNDAVGIKNLRIGGGGVTPGPIEIDKDESHVTTPSETDAAPLAILVGANAGKTVKKESSDGNGGGAPRNATVADNTNTPIGGGTVTPPAGPAPSGF